MSLIEEALRKQAREEQRHKPHAAHAGRGATQTHAFHPPVVSAPNGAHPVHPDFDRQRSLTLMMLGGVGLLGLLLLAGIVFLVLAHASRPVAPDAAVPVARPPAAITSAVASVVGVAMTVTQLPPAACSTAVAPAAVATVVQGAAAVATAAVVAVVFTGQEAHVAGAPVPSPSPPVVVWPEIVVKGMFTVGGRTQVIFGDGSTLEAGMTLSNGVRLLDAGSGWVRVSFRGQTRTYRRNSVPFTAETPENPARP